MEPSLEIFPWNENFETGIPTIDEQHQKLVALLNSLVSHLAFQADAPALNSVFDQLRDYTVVHFRDEEVIWKAELGDDPWVTGHHGAHTNFVDEVLRLKAEEATRPLDDVIEDIVGFLTHWLALHIIDSDKRMAITVRARHGGMSLEQAKAFANEEMAGATRVMIDTIMTMYDKLANQTVQLTREISRRMTAEARLQQTNAALYQAKEEAIAANEAKSIYVANISHEIRTPVNAIAGLARILRKDGVRPEQEKLLHDIESTSEHLLRIVNDLLDLSKIEAGKLDLEVLPLKLNELLDSVVAMQKAPAREKGLDLTIELNGNPVNLVGDPTRLRQALLNYLGNAIKFTESGGVTIRANVLEDLPDNQLVRFEVQDSGIGLAPEAASRLFSSFEQADPTISRKFGGTGLGLAITRKLAILMGGEVGVESVQGTGSTFWFSARLKKDSNGKLGTPPQVGLPPQETIKRDFAGARVLLVEDNDINQQVATFLLNEAGLEVDVAGDGLIALDYAARNAYAVVLMDMKMPNMGGIEATPRMRQIPGFSTTPILAMTAHSDATNRAECMKAGMNDFIIKPVEPDLFFETLLRWLRQS